MNDRPGGTRRDGGTAAFEPKVVVFACNWCSYAGADLAGVGRMRYAPNVRLLRTMCSGRINPSFVLRAFEAGADGVLVSGCHPGDCHYSFGNLRARDQAERTRKLLHLLGVEPGRFRLEWFSAAEGGRFARVIDELVDEVRSLGPSPYATRQPSPESGNGRRKIYPLLRPSPSAVPDLGEATDR